MTRKALNVIKWGASLGESPQNFLGAKWVRQILERSSPEKKRIWALRLLSLSPHYFYKPDAPQYRGMSNDEYLEKSFSDNVQAREDIFSHLLKDHLAPDDVVLDYGCGPGFLAKVMAPHVAQVIACDISQGALACAQVINTAPNLRYVRAVETGLRTIEDESVDVAVSYAMIQHLTDDVFELVLRNCRQKLKPGGRLILHIQLLDEVWKSEKDWRSDSSVKGKLKFRYGLHCFGRSEETHIAMVRKHGFEEIRVQNIMSLVDLANEDISSQRLLTAVKIQA